jgi:adenine-specific DNA methylase
MGWFFGFKLHLICSERGELLNFMITPVDVVDKKSLENKAFVDMFMASWSVTRDINAFFRRSLL